MKLFRMLLILLQGNYLDSIALLNKTKDMNND